MNEKLLTCIKKMIFYRIDISSKLLLIIFNNTLDFIMLVIIIDKLSSPADSHFPMGLIILLFITFFIPGVLQLSYVEIEKLVSKLIKYEISNINIFFCFLVLIDFFKLFLFNSLTHTEKINPDPLVFFPPFTSFEILLTYFIAIKCISFLLLIVFRKKKT